MTWIGSFVVLLQWRVLRRRREIVEVIVLQALVSVGTVIGIGFMQPRVDRAAALFIVTGAATLNIAMAGLVAVPQELSAARERGTLDFMLGLPIPRLAMLAADLADTLITSIPGVAAALVVGMLRYGYSYELGPLLPLAFVMTALTAAALGYALALASPSPQLTRLLTQVVIFGLFLFSPLLFPTGRLPGAMATLHALLPVRYMADAIRGSLTDLPGVSLIAAFGVLGAWSFASLTLAAAMLNRRS